MKIVSKKIRGSAKGQDCTLRLVNICNFNSETTILAHVGSDSGWATKCSDNIAVYSCSDCHAEIDRCSRGAYADDKLRALEETQGVLIQQGLLEFK